MYLTALNKAFPQGFARRGLFLTRTIRIGMKMTFILLFSCALHVCATGLSQQVTLKKQNATLEEVFKEIRKQTGYNFLFTSSTLQNARKVSIDVQKASLTEVMAICAKGQDFTYQITGKSIVVKENTKLLYAAMTPPDFVLIRGKITNEKGEPLVGAAVRVKGQNRGTQTTADGMFQLLTQEGVDLEISFLGYEVATLKVERSLPKGLTIALNPVSGDLNEVQITAYGKTTKRLNTGNIVTINAAEIAKHPVPNVLQVLKDRVPGMFIEQRTGVPGGSFSVQIRGNNSLSDNMPLFVVDGVAYPGAEELPLVKPGGNRNQFLGGNALNYLNPNDIESIDVLKDADATALYGSRGAYGVVLITTKKAKSGKSRFTVSSNTGVSMRPKLPQMLNTEEYIMLRKEALKNDGIAAPAATDLDINGTWSDTKYTNWQKELLGRVSVVNDVNATYTGGTGNTNFLIGGNYNKQGSIARGKGSNRGGTFRFDVNNTTPDNKLFIDLSGSFSSTVNDAIPIDLSGDASTISAPNAPDLFLPNGSLNWERGSNPFAALNLDYKLLINNLLANSVIRYKPVKGLSLVARIGFNQLVGREFRSTPSTYFNPATIENNLRNTTSYINNFTKRSWTFDPHVIYETGLGRKGKLTNTTGVTLQDQLNVASTITGTNFISDALLINPTLGATVGATYDQAFVKYIGFFTSFNYNWDNKYILSVNARRDGSTKFGPGHRFGNFGSVAGAWIFSEENWMKKNLRFISLGKIRASYGLTRRWYS
jgi:TonB-linked SusC/RagA family outer membrane protein